MSNNSIPAMPIMFDNINSRLRDDLKENITKHSKLRIAAACFSIYAYEELKANLEKIDELQFIFTSPTFTTEKAEKTKREFYIPRMSREKSLYGSEFEVRLRNELSQKAIAKECAEWIKKKVTFKSNTTNQLMQGFINLDNGENQYTYTPINEFTTVDLGCERGNYAYNFTQRLPYPISASYINLFEQLWNNKQQFQNVTDEVIESISAVYNENSPEFIYFVTLYNIFNEFLEDISEDTLPNEATGFKSSKIWNMLYNFQKDAALAIINKLERYNGCILADSVGLGKTFTALAVIKYYESRNKNVLLLCPKKLSNNWNTYRDNYINNPLAEDRLNYKVLYHTDIGRVRGMSNGTDLSRLRWDTYDLVVIDESHNFRNGGKLDGGEDEKENRYTQLLKNVIRKGVKTKVLMLSATPVNTRFNDLKNQLQLAYEGDSSQLDEKLKTTRTIDEIFKNAQKAFNTWSKWDPCDRTTDKLLKMLDFDFFEVLDSVTIARSRKQIERFYDTADIGKFPNRLPPKSHRPQLTDLKEAINYNEIFNQLSLLNLDIYRPSHYILPSRMDKYAELYGDNKVNIGFTQANREQGIRRLMAINLMKRMESSVFSFNLTLQSHFEKEEKLFEMGIKTLSLFFIDEVAKYRQYDEDGNELLGEYGEIFEEEYTNVLNEYLTVLDTPYQKYLRGIATSDTHKGYFSIDKKTGRSVNSELKRGSEFSDDISAYELILKNKERLLSFEEPTRFIFSHSALREGWDNPNVFQICTLKHSDSSTQKRQEVGRGLRLCVNQAGNRMDMETLGETIHTINKLTVIASESYKGFVTDLQSDIKKVLYDRPTAATSEYFKGKFVKVGGKPTAIDSKTANAIEFYLIANQYVDMDRKVTDKYRMDLEMGTLAAMPSEIAPMAEGIHTLVQAVFDESVLARMIDDGKQTKVEKNDLNENFYKKEFQELWKRINHKYAYSVSFDSAELIEKSVRHIDNELVVSELTYTVSKGEQTDEMDANALERGEAFKSAKTRTTTLKRSDVSQIKYDLVGKIAEGTVLTRKTVVEIIKGISPIKFAMYKANPEEFITKVIRLINEQKATMIVEHISYDQIEGEYDSTIFTAEKSSTSIDKAFKATKHIQDFVFTDGYAEKSVERRFAEDLDNADEVCVYAKLPRGFHIPTPVGNYSPDWAVAFNEGMVKHIFFIAETKGTMESLSLKPIEKAKISCARRLFNEISTENVKYHDVDNYQHLLDVMKSL